MLPSPCLRAPLRLQCRPPGPMALRKLALGTGTAECWLGEQTGLGPAPSPLPPFPSLALGALHCKPAWVSAPFNSFLGRAFSFYMVWVGFFFFFPSAFLLPNNLASISKMQAAQIAPCTRSGQAAGQCPTLSISGCAR